MTNVTKKRKMTKKDKNKKDEKKRKKEHYSSIPDDKCIDKNHMEQITKGKGRKRGN